MKYLVLLWRNSGARQYKLAVIISFVNLVSDGIPKLWSQLPFVNESWCISLQETLYIRLSQCQILALCIRVCHKQYTICLLDCKGCLTTILWPFNKNCAHSLKFVSQYPVCNTIFIFFHTRSF